MIQPTIGRVVWYYPAPSDHLQPHDTEPLTAHVCGVTPQDGGPTLVNLAVFDRNGEGATSRRDVVMHQDEDGEPPVGKGYAAWMPYQKGQAAKTEALEQAAKPAPAAPTSKPAAKK